MRRSLLLASLLMPSIAGAVVPPTPTVVPPALQPLEPPRERPADPTLSKKEIARQKRIGKALARKAKDERPDYEEDEAGLLTKRRIPLPPSDTDYTAWRKSLPAAMERKLARFCSDYGGSVTAACNGIGPLSIPEPPSLAPVPRRRNVDSSEPIETTYERWFAGLSVAQRAYKDEFCAIDPEGHGYSDLCGGTPLVLAFANERVAYTAGEVTDWPTSATPLLVMDRDGDGSITGDELFGNATPMASGARAKNGFEPLTELDANGDGLLDARDPMFARLQIWTDANGDRSSAASELSPLSARVLSLSLRYAREPVCDARRNCEGERADMRWLDANGALQTGSLIDVYLGWK